MADLVAVIPAFSAVTSLQVGVHAMNIADAHFTYPLTDSPTAGRTHLLVPASLIRHTPILVLIGAAIRGLHLGITESFDPSPAAPAEPVVRLRPGGSGDRI